LQDKKNLLGCSQESLEVFFKDIGEPPFRAKQLLKWVHQKGELDFEMMTDFNKDLRSRLKDIAILKTPLVKNVLTSEEGTKKYLVELDSGSSIEMVRIPEKKRMTLCISSQAGCALQCTFCATGAQGFDQNLTSDEIIGQVWLANFYDKNEAPITNVVFMGMGEPFLNYDNTIAAADLLHHPKGINMGAWRITISTAGIISKIKKYTEEKHPYKLAVSLNATSESQRFEIMPITKSHSFEDLLKVSKDYAYHSRKRITFEYVLLKDINDEPSDAFRLKEMLSKTHCKLNIIPYNEIGGKFQRPSDKKIQKFLEPLKDTLFPVTVRWSKGTDIAAGCGQLATEVV
jgi:23S rRNA (adenine2503-C2)-methyltransferase